MSYRIELEGPNKVPKWLYKLAHMAGDDLVAMELHTGLERVRWKFHDGSEVEGPYEIFREAYDDLVGSV